MDGKFYNTVRAFKPILSQWPFNICQRPGGSGSAGSYLKPGIDFSTFYCTVIVFIKFFVAVQIFFLFTLPTLLGPGRMALYAHKKSQITPFKK